MHTFEIEPEIVVHDLHPGYLSTTWARHGPRNAICALIAVQHHHAHIAACMAEHALDRPGDRPLSRWHRLRHRRPHLGRGSSDLPPRRASIASRTLTMYPMPGGEAAIREPWRMALGHLHAAGLDVTEPSTLNFWEQSEQNARVLSAHDRPRRKRTAHIQPWPAFRCGRSRGPPSLCSRLRGAGRH